MAAYEVREVVAHGFATEPPSSEETIFYKTQWNFYPDRQFSWLAEEDLESAKEKVREYLAAIGVATDMTSAERVKKLKATAIKVDRDEEKAGLDLEVVKITGHTIDGKRLMLECVWTTGEVISTPKSAFAGDKKMLDKYLEEQDLSEFAKSRGRPPTATTIPNTGTRSRPATTVPAIGTNSSARRAAKKAVTPEKTPVARVKAGQDKKTPAKSTKKTPVSKVTKAVVKQTPVPKSEPVIRKKAVTAGAIKLQPKAGRTRSTGTPSNRAAVAVASPASPPVARAAGIGAPEILSTFKDKKGVAFLAVEANSGLKNVKAKDFFKDHPEAYVEYLEKRVFDHRH